MRQWLVIAFALGSMGCLDHVAELGPRLTGLKERGDPSSGSGAKLATSCGKSAAEDWISGCLIDSSGAVLEVDGPLPVVPEAPPYGMIVDLDGVVIRQADLESDLDIRVRAYAAPYNLSGCPAFPEGELDREIPARAVLAEDGGVIALVEDPQPRGSQVVFEVQFGRDWLVDHDFPVGSPPEPCTASAEKCNAARYELGYLGRLYVGDEPAVVTSKACNSGN